jgi:hypothetical protein
MFCTINKLKACQTASLFLSQIVKDRTGFLCGQKLKDYGSKDRYSKIGTPAR